MPRRSAAVFVVLLSFAATIHGQSIYQKAPKAIAGVLDAPPPPTTLLSPTREYMLLVEYERYPSIADLSEPKLRLAGLRINPKTLGPHAPPRVVGLTLLEVATGKQRKIAVPPGAKLGQPVWSPDGQRFAFTQTGRDRIDLCIGSVTSTVTEPHPIPSRLNAVLGVPFHWLPGGKQIVCTIDTDHQTRFFLPAEPRVPAGPVVQESAGKKSPVRTHQDLLTSDHDENLFEYYARSDIALIDLVGGSGASTFDRPGLYSDVSPSPDGKYLLVTRIKRPFSRLHPFTAFPHIVEVWDITTNVRGATKVAELPLADKVPIEGVPTGPRAIHWMATEPATLVWVEALDGGDPKTFVPFRDQIVTRRIPDGIPKPFAKTEQRFRSLQFAEKGGPVLLTDYERTRKRFRTLLLDPEKPDGERKSLWNLSVNEMYKHPGTPLLRRLPNGHDILWTHEGKLFLHGRGATPQGDRPFLDRLDPKTGERQRLFQCDEGCYEDAVALLSQDGTRILTRRETAREPPNLFIRTAGEAKTALTQFTDPTPQLRGITKKLVTYKRADGVPLSFTLYLPPDYKEGERLPALLWAYPREFTDADTAGQIIGSPHRFTTLAGASHLFLVLQGYAVLDGAAMPIIGDPDKVNDTFVEQLVAGAQAAIDKADAMGIIDRKRVAVGGHSYGAFMTANLLAHSDLFRAGIARSGAYNRTLTPFGFQSERRTLWEAPETYLKMSPFIFAHKIAAPLLLIHGAADNNDGTFPIQSERLYQAIKGNGGTVRYVSLPHEAHSYVARESVEHTLYEMAAWLDRHVKQAK